MNKPIKPIFPRDFFFPLERSVDGFPFVPSLCIYMISIYECHR